jgi:hypothetical protein
MTPPTPREECERAFRQWNPRGADGLTAFRAGYAAGREWAAKEATDFAVENSKARGETWTNVEVGLLFVRFAAAIRAGGGDD